MRRALASFFCLACITCDSSPWNTGGAGGTAGVGGDNVGSASDNVGGRINPPGGSGWGGGYDPGGGGPGPTMDVDCDTPPVTVGVCGNGTIELGAGEECEPPGTPKCSTTCQLLSCPVGYQLGAESRVCYRLVSGETSADFAFETCATGTPGVVTRLATPNTEAEFNDVAKITAATQAWIGAVYDVDLATFEWLSCEPWTYGSSLPSDAPWGYKEPNGLPNQACVFILKNALWNHPCYLDDFLAKPIEAVCEVAGKVD